MPDDTAAEHPRLTAVRRAIDALVEDLDLDTATLKAALDEIEMEVLVCLEIIDDEDEGR